MNELTNGKMARKDRVNHTGTIQREITKNRFHRLQQGALQLSFVVQASSKRKLTIFSFLYD